MRLVLLLLSILALAAPSARGGIAPTTVPAADAPPVDAAVLDAFVEDRMRRHALPGVAIAVTRGGEVVHARGFGDDGRGNPLTADTPMYVGSLSKSFTALALMQLVDDGLVDLDAPVRTYLPWFELADEAAAATITIRHLLGHASGLSDRQYLEIGRVPDDASLEAGVRDLRRARPIDPVGSAFHYFNPGYATLGLVVQEVSGRPFGDVLRERILDPLAMTRTFTDPDAARAAGLARGHGLVFGVPVPREQPFRGYALPAGFVTSTANDMARYLLAMGDGGRPLLSPGAAEALHTPVMDGGSYAAGWFVDGYRGFRRVQHGGANEFFKAEAVLLPDLDLGLVVLVNQGYLPSAFLAYPDLTNGLVDLLIGERPSAPVVPARFVGYGLALVLATQLLLVARGVRRLPTWARRARSWSRARRIAAVAGHLLGVPAIALGVVLTMEAVLGRGVSPRMAFDAVPDATLLVVIAFLADAGLGLAKAARISPRRGRARGRRAAGGA